MLRRAENKPCERLRSCSPVRRTEAPSRNTRQLARDANESWSTANTHTGQMFSYWPLINVTDPGTVRRVTPPVCEPADTYGSTRFITCGSDTCCISWNFPQRSVKPCQPRSSRDLLRGLVSSLQVALSSARLGSRLDGLRRDPAPSWGSVDTACLCFSLRTVEKTLISSCETNNTDIKAVKNIQRLWEMESLIQGRKWAFYAVLRQFRAPCGRPPCSDATWSCLLFLTSCRVKRTDVNPSNPHPPVGNWTSVPKEEMGKPKKKSECLTKCFKMSKNGFSELLMRFVACC